MLLNLTALSQITTDNSSKKIRIPHTIQKATNENRHRDLVSCFVKNIRTGDSQKYSANANPDTDSSREKNINLFRKPCVLLLGSVSFACIIILGFVVVHLLYNNKKTKEEIKVNKMKYYLEGQITERERVAMDLHDNLGGLISSLRLKFELAMIENFTNGQEVVQIYSLISEVSKSIREISHNLYPPDLSHSSFSDAIKKICMDAAGNSKLIIDCNAQRNLNVNTLVSFELLSVVKELIHNIIKHASASYASIHITQVQSQIIISVKDNGKGYAPGIGLLSGSGLKNVENRVKKLNGRVEIKSAPTEGTEVRIFVNTNRLK